MTKENKIYVGVYGIYIKDGKVLVIRKARGPYLGKYDLPGGGLEFDETMEQCLEREIKEETGARILKKDFFYNNEYCCQYVQNGKSRDFHHLAIYYLVDLDISDLKTDADGEDSLGAELVPYSDLSQLNTSQIAYPVISKLFKES